MHYFFSLLTFLSLWAASVCAQSVRIKDLANVRGVRSNQLTGFGLVIGLAGTGDSPKSLATNQAIANMLSRMGMKMSPQEASSKSVAAVITTADLPAFKRIGDRLDIKVSVIGDAKSLAGGTLLLTPLNAGDGKVYVVAQGAVVTGQASGSGPQVLTAALIPDGGIVEREFQPALAEDGSLVLSLRESDSTNSARVAEEINRHFKGYYAKSLDPISIKVDLPPFFLEQKMEFISELEGLRVNVDHKAVVVLNERTGTVVMGADVAIGEVSIAHGDLSVQVGGEKKGEKKVKKTVVSMGGTTVGDLVETMNALGIKPPDLVGILQSIHAAGALAAELKFL